MRIIFHWSFFYPRCSPVFLHPPNLQSHFLLNSGLVVFVACLCTDAFVWFLPTKSRSSQSALPFPSKVERIESFAFGIMLVLSLISTSMFLLALSNCSSSTGSANSLGYTDVALPLHWLCWRWRWSRCQLIRFGLPSPCRRLRVWIFCLAAFAMKFSLALVLLFLLFAFSSDSDVGVATWLIGLGNTGWNF